MIRPLPAGLAQIVAAYGDPLDYVNNPAQWERVALKTVSLKTGFSIPYAVDPTVKITRIRAHRLVVADIVAAIEECLELGVPRDRLAYGGCYQWRAQRGSLKKLSTHAWGIAIDLDPLRNPRGTPWQPGGKMMHSTIIEVFAERGFRWGNDFAVPDPMHFQCAAKY